MDIPQHTADVLAEAGSKMQYGGSVLAVVLSFVNANAAAIGVLIGLAGLLMNYHFKRKTIKILESKKLADISFDE